MQNNSNLFDSRVIRNVLADNQFGITAVNDLQSLNSRFLLHEELTEIENLIKTGNIEAIKMLNENHSPARQYLEIMTFIDQNDRQFIVTVYDSDQLEQDPQVIKIYPL